MATGTSEQSSVDGKWRNVARFSVTQPGSLSTFVSPSLSSLAMRLPGPLLAAASLLLYSSTMAPSLGGSLDSAEFQRATAALTVVHPTGYPLYLLIGHLWVSIFPFGDVAYRVNFLSGVFASLAVWILYALVNHITARPLAAALAAALFAVQAIPWSQAGVAEINSLHTLLTGLAFLLVFRWSRGQTPLWLAALACGLMASHHRSSMIYLPLLLGFGLFTWRNGEVRLPPRRQAAGAAALFLAPFLAYIYLPLRGHTVYWYANEGFASVALGSWAVPVITRTLSQPLGPRFNLVLFDQAFRGLSGWGLIGLGLLGLLTTLLVWLWRSRGRRGGDAHFDKLRVSAVLLCAAAFVLGVTLAALYDIIDIFDYLAVPLLFWCVLAGAGIAGLMAAADLLRQRLRLPSPALVILRGAIVLGVIALTLVTVAESLARDDLRVDYSKLDRRSRWVEAGPYLRAAPSGSILLGDSISIDEFYYMQKVEGWRPDLLAIYLNDVLVTGGIQLNQWLAEGRAVYLFDKYRELLPSYELEKVGPIWRVTRHRDTPATPRMEHELNRRYGDHLILLGYSLDPRPEQVRAGDQLRLTLYWTATARVYRRYTVYMHVIERIGVMIGQLDDEPYHGYKPTNIWQPGDLIVDTFEIPINPEAHPGTYHLMVGLYDSITVQRLPAFGPDGEPLGDYPVLTAIRIK